MGQARQRPITADFAVVGAGSFGSWTALELARRGHKVVLTDAHGPANSRASSGGETRIIRMSYGSAEHYSEMSLRSLAAWKQTPFFLQTGALFTARSGNAHLEASRRTLRRLKIPAKQLSESALRTHYPQIDFEPGSEGLLEPDSGVLMARQAVQFVVHQAIAAGVQYLQMPVVPGTSSDVIRAQVWIYACGPWLSKLFPEHLGKRIWPTRQDVFFFGVPRGESRFGMLHMPAWVDFDAEIYSLPDIENRGLKVAYDAHGPAFDPEFGERVVSQASIRRMRALVARVFPSLAAAPVVETRVCQYENTSNGDFLIDWIAPGIIAVGGGSGHGFKHGPAVGAYAADLAEGRGRPIPQQFSFASKADRKSREVF
jgi:sarcosine oxidase